MLSKENIIYIIKENYPYLKLEYGVCRIALFGSFINGLPDDESDVDLLIELERPLGLKFLDLAEFLERLLGRNVDILTRAGLHSIRVKRTAEDIIRSLVYV